ncbi:NADH dehydrogenase [ubiquinone] 1 alpha subcomplex subunit 6 [Tetrabaena socialis]|uniref:NADH dehydrogenase [ubiquinone] 1 alpha subcomplex subunit 6 n=1 Tax=Tetrabaena socialis TaxID=47790 RepID=A0A2J7ZVF7_9CHLO|nr:NADH dehydrogenase [ubiquinone] 1 alpha subcomplex subunit 6 [Tetrabaena socialis]|eukprot:PNH04245.1 NADH dehydrogenase [ubiquinone] 1 alpha subcomplex subunit 6 [Tetrabaena socialis]
MASRLAKQAAAAVQQQDRLFGGAARHFYFEICRCLPFIQRLHKMEEMVSQRELRAIVKEKFKEFKDVKDGRVVELLIFKGREEIETYLLMHKQRHHVITEIIEPYYNKQRASKAVSANSNFLNTFLTTGYPQLQQRG